MTTILKSKLLLLISFLAFSYDAQAQVYSKIANALDSKDQEQALEFLKKSELSSKLMISDLKKIIANKEKLKNFPFIHSELLFKIGLSYQDINEPDSSLHYFSQALRLNEEIYNRAGSAKCLYPISRILAIKGSFNKAREIAIRGLHLAKYTGQDELTLQLGNILSWSYFETNQNFDLILEHHDDQLKLAKRLEQSSTTAGVYNNYAYDNTVSGLIHLDSLITTMDISNNYYAEIEGHSGRWYTLMNLTWLYRLKNNFLLSEESAKKSFERAIKIKDRHAIIEAACQYGETLLAQNKVGQAETFYKEALKQRGNEEDRDAFVFDVYYANYLWQTDRRGQAIKRLEQAIDFLKTGEVFYEMHGRALLAEYYFSLGRVKESKEQVDYFKNPRSQYIAFETRCILNNVKAKILAAEEETGMAKAILDSYLKHAQSISAKYLVKLLQKTKAGIK